LLESKIKYYYYDTNMAGKVTMRLKRHLLTCNGNITYTPSVCHMKFSIKTKKKPVSFSQRNRTRSRRVGERIGRNRTRNSLRKGE